MIDLDLYYPNERVEKFLEQLKIKLNKNYPTTKVYISSARPNSHWLQKIYNFYNNEEVKNEQTYL